MASSEPERPERRSIVFSVATLGASTGVALLAYAAGRRLSPATAAPPSSPAPAATGSGPTPAPDRWPDYTGAPWPQTRDQLPRNIRLTVRPVAANTSPVVLSQTPPPGSPRGEVLTLVVRGSATPIPLPDLPDAPLTGSTTTFGPTSYAKSVRLGAREAAKGVTIPLPLASTRLSAAAWASGATTGARATLIVEIGGRLRLRRMLSDRSAQTIAVALAGARSVTIRADLPAGVDAVILGGPIVEAIG